MAAASAVRATAASQASPTACILTSPDLRQRTTAAAVLLSYLFVFLIGCNAFLASFRGFEEETFFHHGPSFFNRLK